MTLPDPYRGPFCSELTRVVPTDEIADCVAASGIDIANAATRALNAHIVRLEEQIVALQAPD